MIESGHTLDAVTGLPLYSLYSKQRRPDKEMFDLFDVLIIDLFDVGTRVYTFLYTMAYCLEAAAAFGKKVLVLDRPNPVGGKLIEGNIIQQDCYSFVGLYPIPMRHGLTIGELALFFRQWRRLDVDLDVAWMQGWRREMDFEATGLPWVLPSPNMPTPDTAWVYPGGCLLEGTTISEGRGTTRPFEIFGAPFLDPEELAAALEEAARKPVSYGAQHRLEIDVAERIQAAVPCAERVAFTSSGVSNLGNNVIAWNEAATSGVLTSGCFLTWLTTAVLRPEKEKSRPSSSIRPAWR